jgi:hypothetical protein
VTQYHYITIFYHRQPVLSTAVAKFLNFFLIILKEQAAKDSLKIRDKSQTRRKLNQELGEKLKGENRHGHEGKPCFLSSATAASG